MQQVRHPGRVVTERVEHQAQLDLVVPFTTPRLTQAALNAANRLGAGLNVEIRLLKVQMVPFPLDLERSPVPVEFLTRQLQSFSSSRRTNCEIRLARENQTGLLGALTKTSLVILASD